MHRTLLFLLSFSGLISAQPVHFGVKAGIPAADFFETGSVTNIGEHIQYAWDNHRYMVGPTAEVRLPLGLAIEFDALYRPIDFSSTSTVAEPTGPAVSTSKTSGYAWDFPLMLKVHAGAPLIHPFVEGGPIGRFVGGFDQVTQIETGGSPQQIVTSAVSEFRKQFYTGVTFGVGLELHALKLRISPEFRYTRWTSGTDGPLHFNPNQADFLLGISF
jgi:hypothetical protein